MLCTDLADASFLLALDNVMRSTIILNPLKGRDVNWLHLAIQV